MKIAGYTPLKTSAGRPLFVRLDMKPLFERVLKEYRSDYHMASIMRTLAMLNADALRGQSLNPAGDERAITCGRITMKYSLFNGAALIHLLAIATQAKQTNASLYSVEFDNRRNEWVHSSEIFSLDKTQQWKSQTNTAHFAAVPGRFDSVENAASRMPEHILGGYSKAEYLTKHDKGNQYSLFWIEKGQHKSQGAAESLASIMQQSSRRRLPVNWLIHGHAIHTFKNTAKLINAAPLASAASREKDASVGKATNQSVYFSNPASSDSKESLEKLCAQAGLTFAGMNMNNRDLRRWSTIKNVGRELSKTALIAGAGGSGVFTAANGLKTMGAGGADKVITNGLDALMSGNYFTAAACVVGVGVIVMGARKNIKSLAAGVKCTFGKGNERWYTDDATLLS